MGNREHLIEAGWKQGKLLDPDDSRFKVNALYEIPDGARFLIVSQTCDLIQESFANEPFFEILCLHPLNQKPDGGYLGGKNSRRIEFSLDPPGDDITHWFALPYNRHLINRELLLERQPESSIQDKPLKMILTWLSRRYTRVAFPESFVKRINTRKKPIAKKFSRLNPLVSNVYVRVTPFEELDDTNEYSMEITLVMAAEKFDDAEKWEECDEIKKELEDQLRKCSGIEVDEISVESTAVFTIKDLEGFLEWDYSYLSFREPNDSAMPVDV